MKLIINSEWTEWAISFPNRRYNILMSGSFRQGHKDLEKSAKHMNNLSPQLPNVTAHVN